MKEFVKALLFFVVVPAGGLTVLYWIGTSVASPPSNPYGSPPTVTLPLYGAQAAAQTPPVADERERLGRIEAKLDKLLKLVEDEAAAPVPANQTAGLSPLARAATACATCHDPEAADRQGGGFKLFVPVNDQGGLGFAPLSDRQKQGIVKRLTTTDPSFAMPPPKSPVKLTPEERTALIEAHSPK